MKRNCNLNIPETASRCRSWREANGIVESQTEGLVDVLTALAVEQVGLQVIQEWEEGAALNEETRSANVLLRG